MVSRLASVPVITAFLLATPAHAVGKEANESWRKPGVSFEQYRADALECGNRAYGVQVAMKPYGPAATGFANTVLPAVVWTSLTPGKVTIYTTTYVSGYRNAARLDTIDQLQAVVDGCLVERSYGKFRLTSEEMRVLRGLEKGTLERHRYLHSFSLGGGMSGA